MAARKVVRATARRVVVAAGTQTEEPVSYFASGADKAELKFISSGCSVLDEALGGGYALGRVVNIVGDKSAGKTLSAMEMIANFAIAYPSGWVRYAESEAAFDKPYAAALGIPLHRIIFNSDVPRISKKRKTAEKDDEGQRRRTDKEEASGDQPMETVEDLYEDLEYHLDKFAGKGPGLYIIDSLDALSDDAEMDADFNQASYGGAKPKAIGQLFRRLVQRMEDQEVTFVVISQIRDKLNVGPFQESKTRSGGKALDFYATHIVWLTEIKKIKRTIAKIDRIVGVDVLARVRKNKIGLPFREAEYPILFGYGIDDLTASASWLVDNHRENLLAGLGMSKGGYATLLTNLRNKGGPEVAEMRKKLNALVRTEWAKIETGFLPKASKY